MKALFAALLLTALPVAGHAEALALKTGAWELKKRTAITGVPIAKEVLEKSTPAQRDEMQVALRAQADDGDRQKTRSCLTAAALASGDLLGDLKPNCTRKVKSQTTRYLELEENCAAPETSRAIIRFEAASVEGYTGSIDRTVGNGTITVQVTGRWVGPTCAETPAN